MNHDHEEPSCSLARFQASAWIDGEWSSSAALLAHLERCAACRSHVEALRAVRDRLEPLRKEEPVRDLWPAIEARAITASAARRTWSSPARRIAAASLGFLGTAALLQGASCFGERAAENVVENRPKWPAALHGELASMRDLRSSPEQRLLDAFENRNGEQR